VDGIVCRLRLTPELPPAPPPPPRAAPDMALWRQQARARAFELELPVSLRIADTRMPVTRVAELVEGDIIPLDRPDKLDVMAAGRRIARLPASSFQFAPETGRTDTSGSDEATSDGVSSR
ncbi:MAG: FliM/FliN family flagellar motor C-terminal domain-containing protein, partial [Sandaracinobacteroides sp.]